MTCPNTTISNSIIDSIPWTLLAVQLSPTQLHPLLPLLLTALSSVSWLGVGGQGKRGVYVRSVQRQSVHHPLPPMLCAVPMLWNIAWMLVPSRADVSKNSRFSEVAYSCASCIQWRPFISQHPREHNHNNHNQHQRFTSASTWRCFFMSTLFPASAIVTSPSPRLCNSFTHVLAPFGPSYVS